MYDYQFSNHFWKMMGGKPKSICFSNHLYPTTKGDNFAGVRNLHLHSEYLSFPMCQLDRLMAWLIKKSLLLLQNLFHANQCQQLIKTKKGVRYVRDACIPMQLHLPHGCLACFVAAACDFWTPLARASQNLNRDNHNHPWSQNHQNKENYRILTRCLK